MQTSAATARTSEGAGSSPAPRRLKWPRRLLLAHLELQDGLCCYCGKPMRTNGRLGERPTLEHFVPTCRMGRTTFANTAAACGVCNEDKGSLTREEYLAVLAVRRGNADDGR